MSSELNPTPGAGPLPFFVSTRPELGGHATVEVSSTIQASGILTGLSADDRGPVDVGGKEISGHLVLSQRRLNLAVPPDPFKSQETPDEELSPC